MVVGSSATVSDLYYVVRSFFPSAGACLCVSGFVHARVDGEGACWVGEVVQERRRGNLNARAKASGYLPVVGAREGT